MKCFQIVLEQPVTDPCICSACTIIVSIANNMGEICNGISITEALYIPAQTKLPKSAQNGFNKQ